MGEGCGDHLRSVDSDGEAPAGKVYCTLCGVWLLAKGSVVRDHGFGDNKKQEDGPFRSHPGLHATKTAAAPAKTPPAGNAASTTNNGVTPWHTLLNCVHLLFLSPGLLGVCLNPNDALSVCWLERCMVMGVCTHRRRPVFGNSS